MGLIDSFSAEDRVNVKFSDFYNLMKEAARAEMIKDLAIVEKDNWYAGNIIRKLAMNGEEHETD